MSIFQVGDTPIQRRHRMSCHCGRCGIYTHHQRRSFPDQYGYNVACLEGVNPFLLPEVPVRDGVHHPADRASE